MISTKQNIIKYGKCCHVEKELDGHWVGTRHRTRTNVQGDRFYFNTGNNFAAELHGMGLV